MDQGRPTGVSLAECVVSLAILALALGAVIPAAASLRSGARLAAGAREFALTLQSMRWKSVARHRGLGLLFQRDGRGWYWQVVEDGNGNGLRVSEVADGIDRILTGPQRLEDRVSGVRPGFPEGRTIPALPARSGDLDLNEDPIRFGRTNLIAFGALGTSSSGTVYLTDGQGALAAVSLYGPTARVRVWQFDRRAGVWGP